MTEPARRDAFDVEAILAVPRTDPTATAHAAQIGGDALFTWEYTLERPALRRLYEKAKTGQWNATTDLPWDTPVDPERVAAADRALNQQFDPSRFDRTPVATWGDREWTAFAIEQRRWMLSQFLHGEQGALLCTAKLATNVPWYDAKLYASTQVVDEARHVEVFGRYIDEKLDGQYPIDAHLRLLLDDVLADEQWDMTYLGMQILVEGLALAAFGYLSQLTAEPLLKQLLRYVMSDEARHVAFGVLSLQEIYAGLSDRELLARQEFTYEASLRMRDRFLAQEVWEHMGVDPKIVVPLTVDDPQRILFQQMLFAKIVPNCRKLGLLDRNDGWLRRRFEELGVIEFEHLEDTGTEYAEFALTD